MLILAALPLALGVIPPNRWYGFRVPGALQNPELWYDLNELAGKLVVAAMVLCAGINLLIVWKAPAGVLRFLGWINAALILMSFWLVTLELVGSMPG